MINLDHWHIELSSICTLKCPRCPRTEVPESLLNQQLSLNFFQTRIGADNIRNIRKITFCGNDGDPIYCKDLIPICQWIKSINPGVELVIITNGSFKSVEWWGKLASILTANDSVHWSIDGWDHNSNCQYRINSDWQSIQQGISTFFSYNTTSYRIWASIAFKFNENHISDIKELARSCGFDEFQLTKSTKFNGTYLQNDSNDNLKPLNSLLVSSTHRYERLTYSLSDKIKPGQQLKEIFLQRSKSISPHSGLCLIGNKGVFVNSLGEFYPCCWTANRYPHNSFWHHKFNLNTQTFDTIIKDPFWTTEFVKFDHYECKTKCTTEKLNDPVHVSEW